MRAKSRRTPDPLRNKFGQALSTRGAQMRQRLLNATRTLLAKRSPIDLTVHAIAKAARVSPASFYVHFESVADALLALAWAVDGKELLPFVQQPWPAKERAARAKAFMEAFYKFWDANRRILAVRNLESDLGDNRFFHVRYTLSLPIVDGLATRIVEGNRGQLSFEDAWARAGAVFAGFEQLCLYPSRTYIPERPVTVKKMIDAQVDILLRLMPK